MVLLHTPEKTDDFKAPPFDLKGVDDAQHSLESCMGENGLLVMFICNHCPYVQAIADRLATTCTNLQKEGIGCVAIMSNDAEKYPADSFENMKKFAEQRNFDFPYVIDETQEVAKAYGAVCTPDFFGFNKDGVLQYRGRLDSAGSSPAEKNTAPELYNAMMTVKETGEAPTEKQVASMGCSIKWKE